MFQVITRSVMLVSVAFAAIVAGLYLLSGMGAL